MDVHEEMVRSLDRTAGRQERNAEGHGDGGRRGPLISSEDSGASLEQHVYLLLYDCGVTAGLLEHRYAGLILPGKQVALICLCNLFAGQLGCITERQADTSSGLQPPGFEHMSSSLPSLR